MNNVHQESNPMWGVEVNEVVRGGKKKYIYISPPLSP